MFKNNMFVFVSIVGLMAVFLSAMSLSTTTETIAAPSGVQVDDFQFTTTDGQVVNLYSFQGKPVVIDWAASWCSVCKANQESMNDIYPYYKDNVHFLTISFGGSGDDLDDVKRMKTDRNYQWTFGLDTNNKAADFGTRNGYVWVLNADMSLAKEWAYTIVSVSQLQEQLNSILPENQRVGTEINAGNNNAPATNLLDNPLFIGFIGSSILLVGVLAFLRLRPQKQTSTSRLAIEGANKKENRLKQLQAALNEDSSPRSSSRNSDTRKLQPRNKR